MIADVGPRTFSRLADRTEPDGQAVDELESGFFGYRCSPWYNRYVAGFVTKFGHDISWSARSVERRQSVGPLLAAARRKRGIRVGSGATVAVRTESRGYVVQPAIDRIGKSLDLHSVWLRVATSFPAWRRFLLTASCSLRGGHLRASRCVLYKVRDPC